MQDASKPQPDSERPNLQLPVEGMRDAFDPTLDDPKYFINRELSLLEFNRRVLEEGADPTNPLLERVKFLAITHTNLNEFYMVRVAGLKQQIEAGVVDIPADGLTAAEQLAAIRKSGQQLLEEGGTVFGQLQRELCETGIYLLDYKELSEKQRANAQAYFNEMIFPVLTPLAVDPSRPFPFIANLSLNLAVLLRDANGDDVFAHIKVPNTLPRLVPLKRSSGGLRRDGTAPRKHYLVWLEQVIVAHLGTLFPGLELVEAHPFHVTRDADLDIQELEAADLLDHIEATVRRRRFGRVVCLLFDKALPQRVRKLLVSEMDVDPNDIYELNTPLGLGDLMQLHDIERHDLKDRPFKPAQPLQSQLDSMQGDLFAAIRREDILLHHPYDSFSPVVDFLETAARDPYVLAIKITLYRVGRNSPVVDALLEAMERGKQVTVLVELKARFDEESNIGWARKLENAGVHVVYGLLGLKTHSKVALVVRKEGDGIRRYTHLATGNYNPVTANHYTDLGLFTASEEIGADASHLFNYLTGYSHKTDYTVLMVAPINLRHRMEQLIKREIAHAEAGRDARLIFKMNSLVDKRMIQLLYRASQAGVQVDLIVRGVCCLRPQLAGVSDHIRVASVVGRFLEHSRIYYFENGGSDEAYLGSADLMPRNIDRRVEVIFPIRKAEPRRYLRDVVLAIYLKDDVKARELGADGNYRRKEAGDRAQVNAQSELLRQHLLEGDKGIAIVQPIKSPPTS